MSPKDSITALRSRIQQKMEAENDWECEGLNLTPIGDIVISISSLSDSNLTGDQLIKTLLDRIQEVRDLYQQAKSELSWLDRRHRNTIERRSELHCANSNITTCVLEAREKELKRKDPAGLEDSPKTKCSNVDDETLPMGESATPVAESSSHQKMSSTA
jgi:hypothetical protein